MRRLIKPLSVPTFAAAGIWMAALLLTGCTLVGPGSISSGRLDYNAAIADTASQQLLMAIVRNRFQEEASLLAVSSVTANVKMRSGGGVEVGIGDTESFEGNLVPFSAGMYYEENPTISYVPVASQQYIRQLASPISVGSLARLATALSEPVSLFELLVASINGIYNPDFLHEGLAPDPRFGEIVTLFSSLSRGQRLHWVELSDMEETFAIVITDYGDDSLPMVDRLTTLLGIDMPADGSDLVMPVSLAVHGRDSGAIGITTRSVMRLVEIFSASVELSEKEVGYAQLYPPLGPVGEGLRIRQAKHQPEGSSLAVRFRGAWYYIDGRDRKSKGNFRLLSALWSVVISEGAAGISAAPVLTVPVSG
jgi:hypothetical protein